MRIQLQSRWGRCLAVLATAFLAGAALAQPYPSKPVKVIIPWVAGGAVEAFARVVGAKMQESLGQPLLFEARPGANGTIGVAMAAKAVPDGYTLLIGHVGPLTISPAMQTQMQYDAVKDFEPIGQMVSGPTFLVVHPGVPAKSVKELVDFAKANPNKLSYASVGIGSTTHLAGEMVKMMSGAEMLHVPYKGAPPILTDILTGRVQVAFIAITSVLPQVRAGQLRAIGITSLKRVPQFPDLPTVSETLPGFELNSWHGLLAPAGTPKLITARVHEALVSALKAPDVVQWLRDNGLEPSATAPEEFGAYIRSETAKWAKIVKDAKVVAN